MSPYRVAFDELGIVVEVLQSDHAGNDFGTPALYVFASSDSRLLGTIHVTDHYDPMVFALPDSTILFCGKSWGKAPNDSYLIAFNPIHGLLRGFSLESFPRISCATARDLMDSSNVAPLQLGWFGDHYYGEVEFASDTSGNLVIVRNFYTGFFTDTLGNRIPFSDNCVEALRIDLRSGVIAHETSLRAIAPLDESGHPGKLPGLITVRSRRLPGYPSMTGAEHVLKVRRVSFLIALTGLLFSVMACYPRLGRARFWLAAAGMGLLWTFVDPAFERDLGDIARHEVTTGFQGFEPRHSYLNPTYVSFDSILRGAAYWMAGWLVTAAALMYRSRKNAETWILIILGPLFPYAIVTLGLLLGAVPAALMLLVEEPGFDLLYGIPLGILLAWLVNISWFVARFYLVIPLGVATTAALVGLAKADGRRSPSLTQT